MKSIMKVRVNQMNLITGSRINVNHSAMERNFSLVTVGTCNILAFMVTFRLFEQDNNC